MVSAHSILRIINFGGISMSEKENVKFSINNNTVVTIGLVVVLFIGLLNLFLAVNLSNSINTMPRQMAGMMDEISKVKASVATLSSGTGSSNSSSAANDTALLEQIAAEVIATGVPAVYGAELSVSFDEVQDGINKMSLYDTSIELEGADLEKYVAVTASISCEYCCGAEAIAFSDGRAACGCAHSAAMRGLAKYLIKNHNSEFSEAEVLAELAKWKSVFFPKQTISAAVQEKAKKGEISGSALATLPDMVGGC